MIQKPPSNRALSPRRRRKEPRRSSDRLLMETVRVHRTLLDLLHGKSANVSAALQRLKQFDLDLGRRNEDKQIGQALTGGLDAIARRLLELGVIEQLPRKVRLVKVLGKDGSTFPVGTERIGWEMNLPELGQRYCLYLEDGRVFRTGEIKELGRDHFRTGNSVYEMEIMQEGPADSGDVTPFPPAGGPQVR